MIERNFSWREFLQMDEPTLLRLVENSDDMPFVQQSMARRALSEVRRRTLAELQRQHAPAPRPEYPPQAVEDFAEAAVEADGWAPMPEEARYAGQIDYHTQKAMTLCAEAGALAREASANEQLSSTCAERLTQKVAHANMIAIFAVVVALLGMWRG